MFRFASKPTTVNQNSSQTQLFSLSFRSGADAELGAARHLVSDGEGDPRVFGGPGGPAGPAGRARVREGGEEHVHHGSDGGPEQTKGAEGHEQAYQT